METICEYLRYDHGRCDDLLCRADAGVARREWGAALEDFCHYQDCLAEHIRMEENILLPVFLRTLPGSAGPAAMLQAEHRQMLGIVDRMRGAIQREHVVDYVMHAESLAMLMQQHSMKEEDLLYPLLDKALGEKAEPVVSRLAAYIAQHTPPAHRASSVPPG